MVRGVLMEGGVWSGRGVLVEGGVWRERCVEREVYVCKNESKCSM